MPSFFTFIVRLFLVAVGLVFAASVAVAGVVLLALWGVRAAWFKLTGRPVVPFSAKFHVRRGSWGFERGTATASSPRPSPTPRADAVSSVLKSDSVTDVEARVPGPASSP